MKEFHYSFYIWIIPHYNILNKFAIHYLNIDPTQNSITDEKPVPPPGNKVFTIPELKQFNGTKSDANPEEKIYIACSDGKQGGIRHV